LLYDKSVFIDVSLIITSGYKMYTNENTNIYRNV